MVNSATGSMQSKEALVVNLTVPEFFMSLRILPSPPPCLWGGRTLLNRHRLTIRPGAFGEIALPAIAPAMILTNYTTFKPYARRV
jgi:hypothetical protein